MKPELQDDSMCYVCGKNNPVGLKLKFDHPKEGLLKSEVVFSKEHQGFKGIVHGGMLGVVLDEMMVNLAWLEKTPAVTAELKVRLKKPTPVGVCVRLEGRIEKRTTRILEASATASTESGEVLATATATCVIIPDAAKTLDAPRG